MPKTLVFFLWLVATVGVTFVSNAAVELVDLQVFPDREQIEVLSLSEPQSDDSLSELSTTTVLAPTTTLPSTPTTVSEFENTNVTEIEELFSTEEVSEESNFDISTDEILTPTVSFPLIEEKSPENGTVIENDELLGDENELQNENTIVDLSELTPEISTATSISTTTTSTTTTTILKNEIVELVENLADESFELRVGSAYEIDVISQVTSPFSSLSYEGKLPVGMKIDEKGFLTGKPLESGLFEVKLSLKQDGTNVSQKTISLIINEFRVISARGGSVTVIVSGESVIFFSALNSAGFNPPDVIKSGPLMVDVAFYPSTGDETSWVRCEASEVVTCSSG